MRPWTVALVAAFVGAWAVQADLKKYVAEPDDSFQFEKRAETTTLGVRLIEYKMVSQTWRGDEWKHLVVIAIPPKELMKTNEFGLMVVGGSDWKDEFDQPPADPNSLSKSAAQLVYVARLAGMPVISVEQVPFQPILDGMREDEAISYTFEQYLHTQDSTWPLLLPMVKAAVRTMDLVQRVGPELGTNVEKFTVAGASKRGWTTWLTSVVDPRVVAIAPMVIDTLNMGPQMKHQLFSFGKYSRSIEDYTRRGLQGKIESEVGAALNRIVDPYAYREELTDPKLIILGTNDEYWPLDALSLYWDGLPGEKYILYVPNNKHDLTDIPRIAASGTALALKAAGLLEFPKQEWNIQANAQGIDLSIQTNVKPVAVRAWIAYAPTRDFREAVWKSAPIEAAAAGGDSSDDEAYQYHLDAPSSGYAALLGECEYQVDGRKLYLSTHVKIFAPAEAPASAPAAN